MPTNWLTGRGEDPWQSEDAIREEIFGSSRFEEHATTLAAAQVVTTSPKRVRALRQRLTENAGVLLDAHRRIEEAVASGEQVTPAAEWLVNNSHIVEELTRGIRRMLPPAYYRNLPKLAAGPFAGYPRIFGIAWAFVAHTDSRLEVALLETFVEAYQRVSPLTIGELWALPISINLVLVENLRRAAMRIVMSRDQRREADRYLQSRSAAQARGDAVHRRVPFMDDAGALRLAFSVQIIHRLGELEDHSPAVAHDLRREIDALPEPADELVRREQQTIGATNISVRHVIRSMRMMPEIDWRVVVERLCLVDREFERGDAYREMDFSTRNAYRSEVESLARRSPLGEIEIARQAVDMACRAVAGSKEAEPGFYLIGRGRLQLRGAIGFVHRLRDIPSSIARRGDLGGYAAIITVLTLAILGLPVTVLLGNNVTPGAIALLALSGLLPAVELAVAIVTQAVLSEIEPALIPSLRLHDGVPDDARTFVVVPTLIANETSIAELVDRLETHHLATQQRNVYYALLTDWLDHAAERTENDDALLNCAQAGIDRLNREYGPASDGAALFHLFHRRRQWNAAEGCWMGWERKRGKLLEFNRLLRGKAGGSFLTPQGGPAEVPARIRYVITLDSDTQLPRDAALRLIGKMLHPLNRPVFCNSQQRIIDGHGLLQPRIVPGLPTENAASQFQKLFSTAGGIDPYAGAVSDLYQDLFGEGSYTGKGIYDVDAFEFATDGRFPDNAVLSHDLLEGIYVRAGLATDIELIEEFPSRYDVARSRDHRWTRGDWQLLPWVVAGRSRLFYSGERRPVDFLPSLGRWKLFDNLRRSLTPIAIVLTLTIGWLQPLPIAAIWTVFIAATITIPNFLSIMARISSTDRESTFVSQLAALAGDAVLAIGQSAMQIVLLADKAFVMADATVRTLYRLFVSRRKLLEWTTAAQAKVMAAHRTIDYFGRMSGGVLIAAVVLLTAMAGRSNGVFIALPVVLLWMAAPWVARWISFRRFGAPRAKLESGTRSALRAIARETWVYFETFVTAEDNHLPPDNFQEEPRGVVAHRTSPTNVGLYLLSTVSAREFGWISTSDGATRLELTLRTLGTLQRFKGHYYNWYDTRTTAVLEPRYVSAVDSGNLAGHLMAVASACRAWSEAHDEAELGRMAAAEALNKVVDCVSVEDVVAAGLLSTLRTQLPPIAILPEGKVRSQIDWAGARQTSAKLSAHIQSASSAPRTIQAVAMLLRAVESHAQHDGLDEPGRRALQRRLQAIADAADYLVETMDFSFLVESNRKLFSIGYSVDAGTLDESCYDLLASEARLASLVAIAKGDVEKRHWFMLGRTLLPVNGSAILASWTGSMFEYLMPDLVTLTPPDSLVGKSSRNAVETQMRYGRSKGTPWGISESAYSARDIEFTYQYLSFGIPQLGLKRGLGDNHVVAPYATGLASMVEPNAAAANYAALERLGARGLFGFYDAVDFTEARVPSAERCVIVKNYMAHHQGMTIVAIANAVLDQRIAQYFHSAPMIKAVELLLHERAPRLVPKTAPRATLMRVRSDEDDLVSRAVRRIGPMTTTAPETHIIGNKQMTVMMTAAGSGCISWSGLAVTRWNGDPTLDDLGSYIYLRDRGTGAVWSVGQQPAGHGADSYEAAFSEDRIQFSRVDGVLRTTLEVVVSPEDDATCRCLTIKNAGLKSRSIEITSYDELVLGNLDADGAHPAFSKLFVETDHDATEDVLYATRRRRDPAEASVAAAAFVTSDAPEGEMEFETDRARFIGRNRNLGSPLAVIAGQKLANTVGAVLDPVFAMRKRVTIRPGGTVRLKFWMLVGRDKAALRELVHKYREATAYSRTATLAWTQALVELRHLGVTAEDAQLFQQLAGHILYGSPLLRARELTLTTGALGYQELWPASISGDRPICLVYIDEASDIGLVRQLLHAYEYWRSKRIEIDLVIVNTRVASYSQELQHQLESLFNAVSSRHRLGHDHAKGSVFLLRADLQAERTLRALPAAARAILYARRGSLGDQLARGKKEHVDLRPPRRFSPREVASDIIDMSGLELWNGFGGFSRGGRDYVIVLNGSQQTPAPWVNVIANPSFGFQVSAEGGGYTWSMNSRERQITPWSNDPVSNRPVEVFYIRDEDTGEVWSPTALPVRDYAAPYIVTHGQGFTRFTHASRGIELTLEVFVAESDPVKISRLRVRNQCGRPRRLTVTSYVEWQLGRSRRRSGHEVITEYDADLRAVLARNPWEPFFPTRVAFSAMRRKISGWTADRGAFIGRGGTLANPAGLASGTTLNEQSGALPDPCAALRTALSLPIDGAEEVVTILGDAADANEAHRLIKAYASADPQKILDGVVASWDSILDAVEIKTPDRALDIMVNRWLPYQTLACRIWGRAGFYQAGGAYGFRDQLQDTLSLLFSRPDEARAQIMRAAGRQFVEGDVLHWWLEPSGHGIRNRISDGCLWLPYVASHYVASTGDTGALDEPIGFLSGPLLEPHEHEVYMLPADSGQSGSLYEHCARAIDRSLGTGVNGLALIGSGDWNDGMNRVGIGGKGESVWLSWFLVKCLSDMVPLAEARGERARARKWKAHKVRLVGAIEAKAWDGQWYRRATFDDGTWLGSAMSEECRIDAIAQSWSILSGAGNRERSATAMASVKEHLIDTDGKLSLLFTPPFDKAQRDPGYIKAYPPGIRENGGQYTHAAAWNVIALAKLGDGDGAGELLALLNPIRQAESRQSAGKYKVEPYVMAADIYSVGANEGRGGWTWYTGSAGWVYRAAVEYVLGVKKMGSSLVIDPKIPHHWDGFEVTLRLNGSVVRIVVSNPERICTGIARATMNTTPVAIDRSGVVVIPLDGARGETVVRITLGARQDQRARMDLDLAAS